MIWSEEELEYFFKEIRKCNDWEYFIVLEQILKQMMETFKNRRDDIHPIKQGIEEFL